VWLVDESDLNDISQRVQPTNNTAAKFVDHHRVLSRYATRLRSDAAW
jgi:hypothetical protein